MRRFNKRLTNYHAPPSMFHGHRLSYSMPFHIREPILKVRIGSIIAICVCNHHPCVTLRDNNVSRLQIYHGLVGDLMLKGCTSPRDTHTFPPECHKSPTSQQSIQNNHPEVNAFHCTGKPVILSTVRVAVGTVGTIGSYRARKKTSQSQWAIGRPASHAARLSVEKRWADLSWEPTRAELNRN